MSFKQFGPNEALTEGSTGKYSCAFTDLSGNTVSEVTAIKASLLDHVGAPINGRDEQDVLNTDGGTFDANTFTLVLSPDDTVAVGSAELQPRVLLLRVTYDDGALTHRVSFFIRNTEL